MSASAKELVTAAVSRTQIVRFAGVAGDFNPMHHDEPFALSAGQPSVFAMGQLTAAIVADVLAGWFGANNFAGYGVRFRDKVWPGDRLVVRAEPDGPHGDCWNLAVRRDGDGAVVLTGWARLCGAPG
jgi:acyl dehydratase